MSAFVVSHDHIDFMVTAALNATPLRHGSPVRWYFPAIERPGDTLATLQTKSHEAQYEDASRIGAMLWAENVRSVNYRYEEDEWEEVYLYRRYTLPITPVQVLKAVNCYEYQTCEHDDWQRSEAYAFCQSLSGAYVGLLPGYDEAKWEISR